MSAYAEVKPLAPPYDENPMPVPRQQPGLYQNSQTPYPGQPQQLQPGLPTAAYYSTTNQYPQGYPAQQPPHPQFQTSATPQRYINATPLSVLGRGSAPVDCPACGQRTMTRTTYEAGNTTHVWAAVLCICFCLGCIPYLMNSLKDVNHHCGSCGVLLATWHRSGIVDVHQHG